MTEPALAAALAAAQGPDPALALATAQKAIAALPGDPRPQALLARALLRLDRLDEADAAIRAALAADPDSVPALIEAAALARRRRDLPAARQALGQLVARVPRHVPFHVDLARVAEELGDPAAALDAWRAVLALAPTFVPAHIGLARAHLAAGQPEAAASAAGAGLMVATDSAELRGLLGIALLRSGPAARALDHLEQAHARMPDWPDLRAALLEALKRTRADPKRILAQSRAVARDLPAGERELKLALDECVFGSPAEVHRLVEDGLCGRPTDVGLRWLRMQTPRRLPHPDADSEARFAAQWIEDLRAIEGGPMDGVDAATAEALLLAASSFHIHYLGRPMVDELRRVGAVVSALAHRVIGDPQALPRRPADGRVRLGICSGFLRTHTVTKLFGSLIEGLDRERIELSLFNTGDVADGVTERLAAHADFFHQRIAPIRQWAEVIRSRELDVLVFLDVGMDGMTQALAATRFAPVQAMLWGHPVTSGLPTIDWFLGAEEMEPADGGAHYTERLHLLPGIGTCYREPPEPRGAPHEVRALSPRSVLAFMPQMVQKIAPEFDVALARVLAGAPELRLAMTPFYRDTEIDRLRERLGRACAHHGVALESRLTLCRWLGQDEWLGVAKRADFALDSFRWSGGNTSLEMFAFDTPIVTLPGAMMRGRHTFAMLRIMELTELIAEDADDYVRIAIQLARSADFRAEMRGRIAERKHRLFDDRRVVDAFGRFVLAQAQAHGQAS